MKKAISNIFYAHTRSFSYISLLTLLLFLASLTVASAGASNDNNSHEDWTEYKSDNGITGYELDRPDSKYLETRSEAIIDAPIEVLLEVLKDVPSYQQWMYRCAGALLLKQESELKRTLYFAQGVPLGSADRQVVIDTVTIENLNQGSYITNIHSINHAPFQIPADEDPDERIWMNEFSGKWNLQMLNRNQTKVIYTAYTDPGGFAPGFIVNDVIRDVTFRSLEGMKRQAKEQQYTDAAKQSEATKHIERAINDGRLVLAP